MTTWNHIPGVFSVEVENVDGYTREVEGQSIPMLDEFIDSEDCLELVIEFVSSGTYQPASMYGGSDRTGWPEERSEDRELVRAYLLDGQTVVGLPIEVQKQLFQTYLREIYAADLKGGE